MALLRQYHISIVFTGHYGNTINIRSNKPLLKDVGDGADACWSGLKEKMCYNPKSWDEMVRITDPGKMRLGAYFASYNDCFSYYSVEKYSKYNIKAILYGLDKEIVLAE